MTPLMGDERFTGMAGTVKDFWRFAMSDLQMNNTRGYLAEYLVARAVGASATRVEWDAYDVLAPYGARIEVKASAYLQSWEQQRSSAIRFTSLTGRTWTPQQGYAAAATYNADVYVFCHHTATTRDAYDPLDVDQWDFYVLARAEVEQLKCKSIGLPALLTAAGPATSFQDLDGRIREAYERQRSDHAATQTTPGKRRST